MNRIIGATTSLAANVANFSIPALQANQYNPFPFEGGGMLWAIAQAHDPAATPITSPRVTANLSIAGEQIALNVNVPTAVFSTEYSQLLKTMINQGQTWEFTWTNLEAVTINLAATIFLYYVDDHMLPMFTV